MDRTERAVTAIVLVAWLLFVGFVFSPWGRDARVSRFIAPVSEGR